MVGGGGGDDAAPPSQSQPVQPQTTDRLSALLGQRWAVAASQLVTLIAIVAYVVATLESLQPWYESTPSASFHYDLVADKAVSRPWAMVLLVLELVCMVLVFAETVIRFMTTGPSIRFFRDPMNILDLVMTAPFFIFFIIVIVIGITEVHFGHEGIRWTINLLRVLRVFRIFRWANPTGASI